MLKALFVKVGYVCFSCGRKINLTLKTLLINEDEIY